MCDGASVVSQSGSYCVECSSSVDVDVWVVEGGAGGGVGGHGQG